MLRKLHLQMTLFCTLVTGGILLALSLLCLFLAGAGIRENNLASFSKELAVLLTTLQSQPFLSHQWLGQTQEEHNLEIYLYNNGEPLYYEVLHPNGDDRLPREVLALAKDRLGFDIFRHNGGQRILHEEFPLEDCYASVGYLELTGGRLSFVILYPLKAQKQQLRILGISILLAGLAALALLSLFAWFFTGRLLRPIGEARKKQARFIASASHELRSPLSVMLSGLEALEKTEAPDKRNHFAAVIRQEGQRMKRLIDNMLLLSASDSRSLTLHREPVWPDELMLCCYERYELLASRQNIRLIFSLSEDVFPECLWDRESVIQVISILLDNALSYTPSGGQIRIALSLCKNSHVRLSVADSGPGIPAPERELVFERFYRLDQARTDKAHFGLGLAAAKELVAAHQGRIWVEAGQQEPLTGAVFLVELPVLGAS